MPVGKALTAAVEVELPSGLRRVAARPAAGGCAGLAAGLAPHGAEGVVKGSGTAGQHEGTPGAES